MLTTKGKFLSSENGQLVKRKSPWPTIIISIIISAFVITVLILSKPNAPYSKVLMGAIKKFFDFSDIKIGLAKITISGTFKESFRLLGNTLMYSVLGTLMGILLSIPFSILCSKNVVEKKWIFTPTRIVFSILRSIPVIVFAFLIFNLVSATLAATLSIALFVMTLMTKWLYEELDSYDFETFHSLKAFGASSYRSLVKSVLPFLFRKAISYGVYCFEIVIRFATILGMVGIPTIGSLLTSKYKEINYWGHMSIVLMILIVTIIIIEIMTWLITKYLIQYKQKTISVDKQLSFDEKIRIIKKNKSKVAYYQVVALAVLVIIAIFAATKVEWKAANAYKLEQFKLNVSNLFKPNKDLLWDFSNPNNAIKLGFEAMVMICASVVIGTVLGTFFGIAASRNISGHFISWPMKLVIITIRSIPTIVYAIMFVLMVDITKISWAGALALGVHSVGMIGKLTYEKIEGLDEGTQEALSVVGANKLLVTRWAIISEAMPSIMSNALYRFEINFKSAVEVGAVGASSFGWQFKIYSGDPTQYSNLSSYILVTIFIVLFFEQVSSLIRKKLLTGRYFAGNGWISKIKHNWIENFIYMLNLHYGKNLDFRKYGYKLAMFELSQEGMKKSKLFKELFQFSSRLKLVERQVKAEEIEKLSEVIINQETINNTALEKTLNKTKKMRLSKFKKRAISRMVHSV